jgi:hypothetical protein
MHKESGHSLAKSRYVLPRSSRPGAEAGNRPKRWPHARAATHFIADAEGRLRYAGDFADGWRTARRWDLATGKEVGTALGHPGIIAAVAFSPDGQVIAVSGARLVRLWRAASGKPIGNGLEHPNGVLGLAFSPDGKTLLTASSSIRRWTPAPADVLAGCGRVSWAASGPVQIVSKVQARIAARARTLLGKKLGVMGLSLTLGRLVICQKNGGWKKKSPERKLASPGFVWVPGRPDPHQTDTQGNRPLSEYRPTTRIGSIKTALPHLPKPAVHRRSPKPAWSPRFPPRSFSRAD